MEEYLVDVNSRKGYYTLPLKAVHQHRLPEPSQHPACWDAVLDTKGRVIFSECSELTTCEIAKLSIYDPESDTYRNMFCLRNYIFPGERTIRDSKVHTSMSWMEDGRLIMVTHTTDKSPAHPAWLPASYYNHIWEGYPGSSLIIFDPVTEKLENRGIPVPKETLYGGIYDKIGRIYYAIGYSRGHLYGISLDDQAVTDYGQVTECASYRIVTGSDDNIYFTTRNGEVQRINVREKKVEDLHIQLPYEVEEGRHRPYFSYAVNGPDGKLYMAGMHDKRLSSYDFKTGKFRTIGSYLAAEQYAKGNIANVYIGSMGFDKNGVLYYAVCGLMKESHPEMELPVLLHRWDVVNGGEPEYLGIPGTPEHIITTTCTMLMDWEHDRLTMVGSNHALNSPDIVCIDLGVLRNCAGERGESVTDAYTVIGNTVHKKFADMISSHNKILAANTPRFLNGDMIPVRVWKMFDGERENSNVVSLSLEGDKIKAVCGKNKFYKLTVALNGEILSREEIARPAEKMWEKVENTDNLPMYPGRSYKSGICKALKISGGRSFCASEDGMLSVENDGCFFCVGPAWLNGPVNDMAVTADGKKVFGVAGDKEDVDIVFSYDDVQGLRYLGPVQGKCAKYGESKSADLTAIAVNADASVVVIGAGGRMGMVYIYRK